MKKLSTFSLILFMITILTGSIFAQSGTGKLAGKILDADTNEPLPGANVMLMNTSQGAATDMNGNYFILNILPGTYDVQISFVGYGSKIIKDVRIVAGITYELNQKLSAGLSMDEIVVTDKKFFEEKSTNTVKVIDSKQIQKLPVKGVSNLASLQAGVVVSEGNGGADGNATINVRGGRGGEVLYIVDGVPQNDAYTGGNNSQVSNAAIDQLSFQIGGYEAKYGQAQSGIINVTTKSGSPTYNVFGDVLTSSFTDDYGYNLYTATVDGPIIPGNKNHTFFLSGERGWFLDADPHAVNLVIPSVGINTSVLPNNSANVWRFTAKTMHNFDPFTVRLSANVNTRDNYTYTHTYAKNNSEHNPLTKRENYSFSGRLSHNLSSSSFWNLNIGYKLYKNESGDGVWFDNIEAYGDTSYNAPYLTIQGSRVNLDPVQLFFGKGRVSNAYSKIHNSSLNVDVDFTSQIDNHLLEVGGGLQYNTLRIYTLGPVVVALDKDTKTLEERIAIQNPFYFGFDITGQNTADNDVYTNYDGRDFLTSAKPKHPVVVYAYVQDRFELSDLVLNLGVRFDYFDSKEQILRDEALPYAFGDPFEFDAADFVSKDPEFFVSPRIGLGFPVTASTVFHAQYGKFIQPPTLQDVVTSINALSSLVKDDNFGVNTGHVNSEETTQYELGFRQVLGDNFGALNLTAFYKNTKGLVNNETVFFRRSEGGQVSRYYRPYNSDFGTIKGFALSLTLSRLSYFSVNLDYTYSLAEGTGSSTNSSVTAAFRNPNGETPKVIAPLDFDQRHTGVINVSFYAPEGELGVFENTSVNAIISFNSGRPYTPLTSQDLTPGANSNWGDNKGYINSTYGPGSNRIDLRVEKEFTIGENIRISPYVWIENLLDADNVVNVYRSTGSASTSGYLLTDEGRKKAETGGAAYVSDYKALEQDPTNYGIPRLIKLGLKVSFSNLSL